MSNSRQSLKTYLNELDKGLETFGYNSDSLIAGQIKNFSTYHKIRSKIYTGGIPDTFARLDESFNKVSNNYLSLHIGFWKLFPVLFATLGENELDKTNLHEIAKQYTKDIFEFKPYTGKCRFQVTIWPKVEIRSLPYGYLLFLMNTSNSADKLISEIETQWKKFPEFDKFGILPPLVADLEGKNIISPTTRTNLNNYPPSIDELKAILFENKKE